MQDTVRQTGTGRQSSRDRLPFDINENGVAQAEKAARRLEQVPVERVFCSPLIRARHTAGIECKDGKLKLLDYVDEEL